ncbi:hypothetical protein A3L23_04146 [Rhodococcoides fascians D188]|nr:hypothetical protein A3L23_04146 [Rhodococcus fascians D188]
MTAGGGVRSWASIASTTSNPLSAPKSISTSTRSGWVDSTASIAEASEVAVPTTDIPADSNSLRAATQKASLSSTIRHCRREGITLSRVSETARVGITASGNSSSRMCR